MRAKKDSVHPRRCVVQMFAALAHHALQQFLAVGVSSICPMHWPGETTPSYTAPDSSAARLRAPTTSGATSSNAATRMVLRGHHLFEDRVAEHARSVAPGEEHQTGVARACLRTGLPSIGQSSASAASRGRALNVSSVAKKRRPKVMQRENRVSGAISDRTRPGDQGAISLVWSHF